MPESKYIVHVMTWTEYERGWGCRSDGASLHLTKEDMDQFIKEYWATQSEEVPNEYSKEDGNPFELQVSEDLYNKVKSTINGLWLLQTDYSKLKVKKITTTTYVSDT